MPQRLTFVPPEGSGWIAQCAQMMAQSSPWQRFGRDYVACLGAFAPDQGRKVHCLICEEQVLGFAVVQELGSFKGYIQTLCVSPEQRGRGLGSLLLDLCEEDIRQYSPNVFICVSSFNERARKLYLSRGYQVVGELPDFVVQGASEWLLRKSYGPLIRSDDSDTAVGIQPVAEFQS